MNIRWLESLLLAALLLSAGLNAAAASREQGGGNDALRKAQYMLQKLSNEKTALQQENQRLADELKKAQEELASATTTLKKSAQENAAAQQRNEALTQRVEHDSARIRDLQATQRKELGDARADIQLLRNAVQEREQWIADCQAKNDGMFKTNSELLAAYRDKGAWDALKQHDPVTGIGSVKVENMQQEYQYRLEDLRTIKFQPTTEAEPAQAQAQAQ